MPQLSAQGIFDKRVKQQIRFVEGAPEEEGNYYTLETIQEVFSNRCVCIQEEKII